MSYYTTIKVVNRDGKVVKAEVKCGGVSKGFTDVNTGEISFDLRSNDSYAVSSSRMGEHASGNVSGGKELTLRLR